MKHNRKSWYVNRWSCHTLLCESLAKIDGAYHRPIWFFESTQFDKHHIGDHDSFIWRILLRQRAIKWNAPWDIIALIKPLISLARLTNGMEYSYVILQSTRGWKANGWRETHLYQSLIFLRWQLRLWPSCDSFCSDWVFQRYYRKGLVSHYPEGGGRYREKWRHLVEVDPHPHTPVMELWIKQLEGDPRGPLRETFCTTAVKIHHTYFNCPGSINRHCCSLIFDELAGWTIQRWEEKGNHEKGNREVRVVLSSIFNPDRGEG